MCRECLEIELKMKKEAEQQAKEEADTLVETILDRITSEMHSNPNWQEVARREIAAGIERMRQ